MAGNMKQNFMSAVEEHERNWGNESYPKRPSLFDILNAPVVVFWEEGETETRHTITLHDTLEEIEKFFIRLLIAKSKEPKKRIVQVFENQEKMILKGVRIVFGKADGD